MANLVRIAIRWAVGAVDEVVCVVHVQAADGHDPADTFTYAALCDAVQEWWRSGAGGFPPASALYGAQIRHETTEVMRLLPTIDDPFICDGEGFGGTYDPIPFGPKYVPPQCCALVGLRTLEDSRRGKGRMYLPAMAWPEVDDDDAATGVIPDDKVPELAAVGACLAAAFRDVEGVGSANWVLAVWSPTDGVSRAVTHFDVNLFFMTQRRRVFSTDVHRGFGLDGVEA